MELISESPPQMTSHLGGKITKCDHPLSDSWTLWAHLPKKADWTINGFTSVATFTTLEDTISVTEALPESFVKNCMLFIMRQGINPMWEDASNRNGGCFSYRIANKYALNAWKKLTYILVGNTFSSNIDTVNLINGITISPKKNFCVIKIWMAADSMQNPEEIASEIEGMNSTGCVFKRHAPES